MTDRHTYLNKVPLIAAVLWLAVPMAWGVATILDRTRVWEGSPAQAWMIGWAALIGAGGLTLWTVVRTIDRSRVPATLVIAGYVAYGLGLAVSIVAGWGATRLDDLVRDRAAAVRQWYGQPPQSVPIRRWGDAVWSRLTGSSHLVEDRHTGFLR